MPALLSWSPPINNRDPVGAMDKTPRRISAMIHQASPGDIPYRSQFYSWGPVLIFLTPSYFVREILSCIELKPFTFTKVRVILRTIDAFPQNENAWKPKTKPGVPSPGKTLKDKSRKAIHPSFSTRLEPNITRPPEIMSDMDKIHHIWMNTDKFSSTKKVKELKRYFSHYIKP